MAVRKKFVVGIRFGCAVSHVGQIMRRNIFVTMFGFVLTVAWHDAPDFSGLSFCLRAREGVVL